MRKKCTTGRPHGIAQLAGEEWRPVPGYGKRYLVSSLGRVAATFPSKGRPTPRILSPRHAPVGYHSVALYSGERTRPFCATVHRLVMLAFTGPRPDGLGINHINGIKTDNRACNLEYATQLENVRHSIRLGLRPPPPRGEDAGGAVLSEKDVLDIRSARASQRQIASSFGINQSTVCRIRRRQTWAHLEEESC